MKATEIIEKVEFPSEVQFTINEENVTAKGPKGEVTKVFNYPKVKLNIEGNEIVIKTFKPSKKEKAVVHTFRAHLRNMVQGVQEPFIYELKICSTHFPMNVTFGNDQITVKNFFGEKNPRILKVKKGVKVKITDKIISLESSDKEAAGTVASDIEQLTRIRNKDLRIFQDGIFIINKAGKELK